MKSSGAKANWDPGSFLKRRKGFSRFPRGWEEVDGRTLGRGTAPGPGEDMGPRAHGGITSERREAWRRASGLRRRKLHWQLAVSQVEGLGLPEGPGVRIGRRGGQAAEPGADELRARPETAVSCADSPMCPAFSLQNNPTGWAGNSGLLQTSLTLRPCFYDF